MSALAEALVAAQRRALAALEKAYVAEKIDKEELSRQISLIGLTDTVDGDFLLASLDVLKEWGAPVPAEPKGSESELATDKQKQLIRDLCGRKNQPEPEDFDLLTKKQASE